MTSIGDVTQAQQCCKPDVALLDLYSGCGAMSTGLCLGGNLSGVNLVTVCCFTYFKQLITRNLFHSFIFFLSVFFFCLTEMGS